jgi:transposase
MRGPYPSELRIRVIDFVEAGGSRREAAEQFQVSASSAIRWVQRFREDGTSEPMPPGGSTSPLEKYSQQILALIRGQRDLTLNEIVSALHKRRIPGSRSALSRFFARHDITFKKTISDGVTPVGVETVGLYRVHGRERPSAFWWRVTP